VDRERAHEARADLRAGFKTSRRCTADPLRHAASSILDGHPVRLRTLSLQGLRLFAQLGPVLKPALTGCCVGAVGHRGVDFGNVG
jgi:hypothetical protein